LQQGVFEHAPRIITGVFIRAPSAATHHKIDYNYNRPKKTWTR
jgi:hypothetical protein